MNSYNEIEPLLNSGLRRFLLLFLLFHRIRCTILFGFGFLFRRILFSSLWLLPLFPSSTNFKCSKNVHRSKFQLLFVVWYINFNYLQSFLLCLSLNMIQTSSKMWWRCSLIFFCHAEASLSNRSQTTCSSVLLPYESSLAIDKSYTTCFRSGRVRNCHNKWKILL